MKRLASILLVAAALGSCSKGNDSPTPPAPSAPSTSSVSLVPSQPIDYISKIEEYQVMGYSDRTRMLIYTYTFEYDDQKRLVSFELSGKFGGSGKVPISYHDHAISFGEDLLTLNPQGKVTKHEEISYEKNKEGVLVKKVTLAGKDYVYDSEGHQLSHTLTEYNTSSEWKDGNLVKRTFIYTGEKSNRRPDVLTQEYSSIPNRTFPDLNLVPKRFFDLGESRPSLWSHIKGTRSAKLISSQSLPLYNEDGSPRGPMESRWTYKLDAKGRPIDLEMSLFFHNFYDRGMAYVITYLDK
jgi:lipoprotein